MVEECVLGSGSFGLGELEEGLAVDDSRLKVRNWLKWLRMTEAGQAEVGRMESSDERDYAAEELRREWGPWVAAEN